MGLSFKTRSSKTRWQGAPRVARQPRRPRPPRPSPARRTLLEREASEPSSPGRASQRPGPAPGAAPGPELQSPETGLGDAEEARFQPRAHPEHWDPEPPALAGNTPQRSTARAAQLRVRPGGQLSTLLSLRGRGGTRSRTPLLREDHRRRGGASPQSAL